MKLKFSASTGTPWSRVRHAISIITLRPQPQSQIQSQTPSDCLFCKQNQPDLNQIMSENKTFYARYDNFPATEGHVEIVPKRHVESFFDLTTKEVKDAYGLILSVKKTLSDKHDPDGYTIGINEGRAAGRTIDHLHIHLIPRRFGDVQDPRGGIRRAVPNCDPDQWQVPNVPPERAAEKMAARHHA
ncbi:HIT family protein [Streptomyces virginiae]|uniref:HIT family protein n=1 Tax=Streptomyces TaxID=1883 RepID=UPI0034491A98